MKNKLTISLDAIADNYNWLNGKARCGAVVKANGYGLGAAPIAERLLKEGCNDFFVALLEEGIELRKTVKEANIFVFHGVEKGETETFAEHRLIPVLNNPAQLQYWPKNMPAAAHFDTGMTRLGFSAKDVSEVKKYNIILVMSHLVSAEMLTPLNDEQQSRFSEIAGHFPKARKSLCNSAGIFNGQKFHFDVARPGIALYGGNPTISENPMENVVTLKAPIIQIHEITKPTTVGYNGIYEAKKGDIIATLPIGYADGIHRTLSNTGKVFAHGVWLPYVGRVSMDLITIKINNLAPEHRHIGEMMEILGDNYTITNMADAAKTIDYEIITRLGNRFERVYI